MATHNPTTDRRIKLNICASELKWPEHIRLTPEAAKIVAMLKRQTGLSVTQIASEIIVQAVDLIDLVEG